MTSPDGPVRVRELTDLLLATPSFEEYVQQIVELAAVRVAPGASCGLTMRVGGTTLTVAASDDLASRADEIQYGTGQGPCLHSMETGTVVTVVDLTEDDRWGDYAEHAVDQGVRSSLSLPISARGQAAAGALNLYFTVPGAFDTGHVQRGMHFADQCSGALQLATRLAEQATLTSQMREAMESRSVIDQAIGIVMAQNRCDAETAFGVLRTASQNRNVKLRAVAADVVRSIAGGAPPARADEGRTAPA